MKRLTVENNQSKRIEDLTELCSLLATCNHYSCLCEFCPHNGLDFEHDDYNCTLDPRIKQLSSELNINIK